MTAKNNIFYNQDIKEQFLDEIDNPVKKLFATLPLRKARRTETIYNKDVYDMTIEELEGVIGDLACSTANAAYNNIVALEGYIDWAISKGYRKANMNPLTYEVDKVEWSKKFVASYKNNYFTRDQIEEMASELVNSSDKAVLLGLFEGIKGKGFSEFLNLMEKDIREKNGIYQARLHDKDGEVRVIEISEMLAMVLINAANSPVYVNKNGHGEGYQATSPLQESEKVFKKAKRGKSEEAELDHTYITRKFLMFKEVYGLKYLKAKHITDSGIMHMANELQKEGVLTSEEIVKIADRFNTPYTYSAGKKHRNVTLLKRIIEVPEFEELYGYKMKFN